LGSGEGREKRRGQGLSVGKEKKKKKKKKRAKSVVAPPFGREGYWKGFRIGGDRRRPQVVRVCFNKSTIQSAARKRIAGRCSSRSTNVARLCGRKRGGDSM